ncbi:hypothetical protein DVA67_032960 [Solirubrobacter sp. CPCC 204708]|uniref:Uncharacterized protein n=1 Tax=Solirubrobacter deserti TaxID=2282478 RepID=A0ABT4RIT1_9ACTN|nr:hypothetical protein [Solirubrobacter deserti]MBE2320816.1 hypothetical protein [Solirubrobacter deserti]MDA0138451.1 hypothetical protein [Solirubrobacter deserti]
MSAFEMLGDPDAAACEGDACLLSTEEAQPDAQTAAGVAIQLPSKLSAASEALPGSGV